MRPSWKTAAIVLFALIFCVSSFKSWHKRATGVDATAFICGAQAVRMHQNPYLVEPIHSCEVQKFTEMGRPLIAEVTMPSPLPFYAYIPVIPLTYLHQMVALVIWYLGMIAAIVASCVMLTRMTGFKWYIVLLAIFIPDVFMSFVMGQIVPFMVCAILGSAWFVERKQFLAASLCAVASLMEPHLGLPLCAALFLTQARTRVPLLVAGVILAGISLSVAPLSQNMMYFKEVLPAHAMTEVHNDEQLSLTHYLSLFGVSDNAALAAGSLAYIVMLAVGCVVSVILSRRQNWQGIALVAAPSLAIIGGTFAHIHQYAVITSFALLLAAKCKENESTPEGMRLSRAASFAVFCLSIPLMPIMFKMDLAMYACICLLLCRELVKASWTISAAVSGALAVAGYAIHRFRFAHAHTRPEELALSAKIHIATVNARLAEDVWLVAQRGSLFEIFGKREVLMNAPLFAAVGILLYILVRFIQSDLRSNRRIPINSI